MDGGINAALGSHGAQIIAYWIYAKHQILVRCNILPSIFCLCTSFPIQAMWKLMHKADIMQETGDTLDQLQVHHRVTQIRLTTIYPSTHIAHISWHEFHNILFITKYFFIYFMFHLWDLLRKAAVMLPKLFLCRFDPFLVPCHKESHGDQCVAALQISLSWQWKWVLAEKLVLQLKTKEKNKEKRKKDYIHRVIIFFELTGQITEINSLAFTAVHAKGFMMYCIFWAY